MKTINSSNPIEFYVKNIETNTPVIYKNVFCSLLFTMKNTTGKNLLFPKGISSFVFYFGKNVKVKKDMKVDSKEWNIMCEDDSFTLTYNGNEGCLWENDKEITFEVSNFNIDTTSKEITIQVNLDETKPEMDSQSFRNIDIQEKPKIGNADLKQTLQLSLDNKGEIYVPGNQNHEDVILESEGYENDLVLNIKNINNIPLYIGKAETKGSPQIEVTFDYGKTSGCLTSIENAWKITSECLNVEEDYTWDIERVDENSPKWVIKPKNENIGLIGIDKKANITFKFSKIITNNPIGHTQMRLCFKGFKKDDSTFYNDEVQVLDINKTTPPSVGIVSACSPLTQLVINNPKEKHKIKLRWVSFCAKKVKVELRAKDAKPKSQEFTSNALLMSQNWEAEIKEISHEADKINATFTAYDEKGLLLGDAKQWEILIQKHYLIDKSDNIYPAIEVNNTLWITKNYVNDLINTNDFYCAKSGKNMQENGFLYNWEEIKNNNDGNGWIIPSTKDWDELFEACGKNNIFEFLTEENPMGFNARMGGFSSKDNPVIQQEGETGVYWAKDENDKKKACTILFDKKNKTKSINKNPSVDKSFYSVRLVKKLACMDDILQLPISSSYSQKIESTMNGQELNKYIADNKGDKHIIIKINKLELQDGQCVDIKDCMISLFVNKLIRRGKCPNGKGDINILGENGQSFFNRAKTGKRGDDQGGKSTNENAAEGGKGKNGENGVKGGDGKKNQASYLRFNEVEIEKKDGKTNPILIVSQSGNGGRGEDGGDGGQGGKGQKGRNCVCMMIRDGGKGGKGGKGGNGGNGGKGGDGGKSDALIQICIPKTYKDLFKFEKREPVGGDGGKAGDYGSGGDGGDGGDGGRVSDGGSKAGQKGDTGDHGVEGNKGSNGNKGSSAKFDVILI